MWWWWLEEGELKRGKEPLVSGQTECSYQQQQRKDGLKWAGGGREEEEGEEEERVFQLGKLPAKLPLYI